MKNLRISDTFSLPPDAVTETFLVLGQRGSGKTNTAAVIAEELFTIGAPFAVLTPIDVWWGLKSSADGSGPGLPIYIFGGDHGDLPLAPTAGRLMADVLIEERISCVICTQGFSGRERARFVTDFAARLLDKNRQPLHLIVEEADAFIPQRPYPGEDEMLGKMDRLIRWGRSPSAIGGTFITQRSAKINKDVSTQCSVLVAHRTAGPQDIDAIKEWFKYHSDPEKQKQVLSEIASLPKGMAFIYSPAWLEHFGKCQIRRRTTFDSAATPKLGAKQIQPKVAVVDLKALETKMAETIEALKADDPRELKKQILALKQEIALVKKQAPETKVERVEVSMLEERDRDRIDDMIHGMRMMVTSLEDVLGVVERIQNETRQASAKIGQLNSVKHSGQFAKLVKSPVLSKAVDNITPKRQTSPHAAEVAGAERKILTVLGQYPEGKERVALAHLSGYTVNGHFNNLLGSLRSKGFAHPGNPIQITLEGLAALGDFDPLPEGEELRKYWLNKIPPAEAKILRPLLEAYPDGLMREEVAEAAGYTVNGHFNNLLGALRTKGIVERGNPIRASKTLFE